MIAVQRRRETVTVSSADVSQALNDLGDIQGGPFFTAWVATLWAQLLDCS